MSHAQGHGTFACMHGCTQPHQDAQRIKPTACCCRSCGRMCLHLCTKGCAAGPRQWMKTVLQPLNEKAAEIVVKHADLLQSSRMEPLLLHLVAHVMAYRVILKRCALLPQRWAHM